MTKLPDTIKAELRALPRRIQRAVRTSLEQGLYDGALDQAPSVALKEAIIGYAVQRYEANKFYLEGARFAQRRAGLKEIADRLYDHEIEQALELGMVNEAAAVAEEKGGAEEVAKFYAERLDDTRLAADYALKAMAESKELAELYRDGGARGHNLGVTNPVDCQHSAALDRAFAAQRQAERYLQKLVIEGPDSPPRVISTDRLKAKERWERMYDVKLGMEHYATVLFNLIPAANDKLEFTVMCLNILDVLPERELRQLMQLYVARGERQGEINGDFYYGHAARIAQRLGDQELADSYKARAIELEPQEINIKKATFLSGKTGREPLADEYGLAL